MAVLEIKLKKDGKVKTYKQKNAPFRKRFEYSKLEADLVERVDSEGNPQPATQYELDLMRIEFVADLFESDEVTVDTIMDGLDIDEGNSVIMEIIFKVLGYSEAELENPSGK